MIRYFFLTLTALAFFSVSHAQYSREWTSGNLGQYGWGGAFGFDIDQDGLVEFEVRKSGQYTFYNGNYTSDWTIPFPGYDYISVLHPRDTDGDGILVPLNTDDDASGELVIVGYYFSGSTYYGRFRVYDASNHSLEYESPLLTGFYGSGSLEDIDGDGKDEIIINRFGSSTTETYVDVYAYQSKINEQRGSYKIQSSFAVSPNPANHQTLISFSISDEETLKSVKVIIYNEIGRQVRILMARQKAIQGDYRLIWDMTDDNDHKVPAGNYFVQIIKGGKSQTYPINLIR